MGERRGAIQGFGRKTLMKRDHLEDLNIDEKMDLQ